MDIFGTSVHNLFRIKVAVHKGYFVLRFETSHLFY